MKDKNAELILKRTEEAKKTYSFKDNNNPHFPADYWFQYPAEGFTLFTVFYTQACRWAQCLGCNLPSQMSKHHIAFNNIMKQVDFIFDFLLEKKQKIELKKIILCNNGSVLDEKTFSITALLYFITKMNIHCPNLSVLTIETRPEYVDIAELEVLSRALKEGKTKTHLELAIGLEAFDNKIRNDHFKKGLDLNILENLIKMIAQYQYKLKAYFMLKPVPNISEEEAIQDVKNGIDYLDNLAKEYSVDINMHLNPTYVAYGTQLEEEYNNGNYTPPNLESVRKSILHAEGKKISIYAGLNDEGLAVDGGSFIKKGDEELLEILNKFNITQDYNILK